MLALLNSLNAHNFPIFQPIVMTLVSKFMAHRALFDKIYLSLGLLFPLINIGDPDQMLHDAASDLVLHCLPMSHKNPFK